jgi:uncharacterized membrane protein YbhN (UPF0104 family)
MWKNIGRILFTIALIALILYKVGPARILNSFKNLDFYYFFLAFLLAPPILYLKSYKWWLLAQAEEKSLSLWPAFRAFLVGLGFSLITPSKVGELGRVFYLEKGDRLRLAGLVIIDKIFDFLLVGMLSFGGAVYFLGRPAAVIILLVSLILAALFFVPGFLVSFLRAIGSWVPFREKIKNVVLSLALLQPKLVLTCLLSTLLSFLLMTFQFYVLLLAFGPTGLKAAFLSYPLILLTNLIPLTIGNLGIREGAAAFLLARFGVAAPAAVNAAFLLFLFDSVIPGLAGAFYSSRARIF